MYIVILITAKDEDEANVIADKVVGEKLVACANIVKGVKSIFWWDNKVDKADEVLIVLKSKEGCFSKIVQTVKKVHSYDVPEIIALSIIDGNRDYLDWIGDSCSA